MLGTVDFHAVKTAQEDENTNYDQERRLWEEYK
jgi:hypothetical protein